MPGRNHPFRSFLSRVPRRSYLTLVVTFVLMAFIPAGTKFPKGLFRSPIRYPIRLTGTFGELRPNHFHSGIDIKSPNGGSGAPILAVADGYVSRIKVSSGGYGNALYINHPNGYTTVYAHLQSFAPAIAKYVKQKQYEKESFRVDLHPPADMFRFAKGQVIGKMGNTGTSSGAHLHFEVRDRRTERPLNAALFGFPIEDKIPPKLHKLKLYYLDHDNTPYREKELRLVKQGKTFHIKSGDTLRVPAERLGLAIKAFDHMGGSRSWNGIYRIDMKVDGIPRFGFRLDEFSFSKTRYVNAHLDYKEKLLKNSTYHRLYRLPGNKLDIYTAVDGILIAGGSQTKEVSIDVFDPFGNRSRLTFWVRFMEPEPIPEKNFNYFFPYDAENQLSFSGLQCRFPPNTFYENQFFTVDISSDAGGVTHFGPVYKLHRLTEPVQKYFDISLPADMLHAAQRPKAYLAHRNKKGQWENAGGKWQYNRLEGRVRELGEYTIMLDNTPPSIIPKNFSHNMAGRKKMSFKLDDDVPTTGKATGLKYRATVDGRWILMEYRNNILTHIFDGHIGKGKHTLRIVATDAVGNKTVFSADFIR